MDTEQERQHPQAHLFTLRLWEEALGDGKIEWRGRLQEIVTGQTGFFRDWSGLIATLTLFLADPQDVQKPAPPMSQTVSEDR